MSVEWIYTATLIALIPIGAFIITSIKSALITFVYGLLMIGICAANLGNPNIVFAPYLQLAVLIMGALYCLLAAQHYRS